MTKSLRPKISVIVVSYNTRELLARCLASLQAHEPEASVIVVDNASRDGSPEMVQDAFPDVTLARMGWNSGFAAANNAGLAFADGSYRVLLNSDTEIHDDCLSRCASWMEGHPEIGATSPRLIGPDGQAQQCVYSFPSLLKIARQSLRLGDRVSGAPSRGWLAGTALMIRREALESIGGRLDETYWMYWEDCDLSSRLLQKGWSIVPFEGGWIRHHGGASGGGADADRRPDLHAWYAFGRMRWFATHRPFVECAGLCALDCLDVVRKLLRGMLRPKRAIERAQAGALARALWCQARGARPAIPGAGRSTHAAG